MAKFDARRDMAINGDERRPGAYALTTAGLRKFGRPEFEIIGVPEIATKAVAANIIYDLADYTVNNAEIRSGEVTVLPKRLEGSDEEPLLFVMKVLWSRQPTGGLFAKMTGKGDPGVLRIVEQKADSADAVPLPLIAMAMVYRAEALRVTNQPEAALLELEGAISIFPGDRTERPGVRLKLGSKDIEGDDNWQNGTAYRRWSTLASKVEGNVYQETFTRCPPLASFELGASLSELASLELADIRQQIEKIKTQNLNAFSVSPGPHSELVMFASPLWRLGAGGRARRGMALLPKGFEQHYFVGDARKALESDSRLVDAVAETVFNSRTTPWHLLPFVHLAREIYGDASSEAKAEVTGTFHPVDELASALLADVGRSVRAGLTIEEIRGRLGLGPAVRDSRAEEKMATLDAWETERYNAAISGPSA